jgi:3-oxoacyl-[acyl-carrier protein] reductase
VNEHIEQDPKPRFSVPIWIGEDVSAGFQKKGMGVPGSQGLAFRHFASGGQAKAGRRGGQRQRFSDRGRDDSMKLKGRVALITGAGSGIGEGIAIRLSEEGCIVVINDLIIERAERAAQKIIKAGGKAFPIMADVADFGQVDVMVKQIIARFKTLHILVNNAGLYLRTRGVRQDISKISIEAWNRFLAVNLSGAFYCAKCVIPYMQKQNTGNIVNMSSQAGKTGGLVNGLHYGASKAGLIGLTKGLARELASCNIRVNCICPGRISTAENLDVPKPFHKRVLQQIPLGRLGEVKEIAAGVLFLVSDDSSYITGEIMDINGGWLMD